MKARFLTVGDRKVRLLYEGTGPALLLLHPLGHSADLFLHNIDALASKFEVIAADLPGQGFADAIDFGKDSVQERTAAHMLALMKELGHRTFAVAGSSYGGLIATLMALSAPDRVRHLIVVGSNSAFGADANQERTLRAVFANASMAMRAPSLESCRIRLGNICFDKSSVPEEILPLQVTYYALNDRLESLELTIENLIASAKSGTGRTYHRLEELAMPTLVIVGRDDIRASWSDHEIATRRIRAGKCIVFERCGHVPFMEHPEMFNTAVSNFLCRTDSLGNLPASQVH